MAQILVVEPAAPLREFLRLHLETAGHQVHAAADAASGAILAGSSRPDLILCGACDAQVLTQVLTLRAACKPAAPPIVLVVEQIDAEVVQRCRDNGVHALLKLPVMRDELLRVVRNLLGGSAPMDCEVQTAKPVDPMQTWVHMRSAWVQPAGIVGADAQATKLDDCVAAVAREHGGSVADEDRGATTLASQEARTGTVLFADIRNFSTLAETLSTQEVADMLSAYYVRACEPILRQRGWIVKLLGDGVLAMFESTGSSESHADRALKAALFLCVVSDRFNEWLRQRFPHQELPEFALGVGVHTGDVMVCRINTGAGVDTTIIGDTVNVASRLEEQTKKLGASVVTSLETLAHAGTRFLPGKRGALLVRGRSSPVEVIEILGLRARADARVAALPTYEVISRAVARNTQVVVRWRDRVLTQPHRFRDTGQFDPLRPDDAPIKIPGFKLLRKLNDGGMSRAFLAEYESTGALRVIKALNVSSGAFDLMRRIVQEHELISQIRHPNVASIYQFGQTDSHAYIVMEYFPAGDLRQRMAQAPRRSEVLAWVAQIADALIAIHERGIIHRDLKPDNLMLRDDGQVVLADFGIAKDLSATLSHTRRGEGLGTPCYLSPEQALGKPVDARSDLYSLGVMLYEMLTGARPYLADDAMGLLHQHVTAPVPKLPAPHTALQPLLDRLMAKVPEERFSTARALREALAAAA